MSIFVGVIFSLVLKIKRSKNGHRKIDPADLNSSRQELSNGGLGIVVALLVCWQIDFFVGSNWMSNPAVLQLLLGSLLSVTSKATLVITHFIN